MPIPATWSPQLLSVLRIVAGLAFMAHGVSKFFGVPPFPMPLNALLDRGGRARTGRRRAAADRAVHAARRVRPVGHVGGGLFHGARAQKLLPRRRIWARRRCCIASSSSISPPPARGRGASMRCGRDPLGRAAARFGDHRGQFAVDFLAGGGMAHAIDLGQAEALADPLHQPIADIIAPALAETPDRRRRRRSSSHRSPGRPYRDRACSVHSAAGHRASTAWRMGLGEFSISV